MILTLLFWFLLPAAPACDLLAGEMAQECKDVCTREAPHCIRRSVHTRDLWAASKMHARSLRRGILSPLCPWDDPESWGVRGPFGLSVSYTARAIGLRCFPPWLFDVPAFSAWAWVQWAEWNCENKDACDPLSRRRQASGAAKWDRKKAQFIFVCALFGGQLGYVRSRVTCEAIDEG